MRKHVIRENIPELDFIVSKYDYYIEGLTTKHIYTGVYDFIYVSPHRLVMNTINGLFLNDLTTNTLTGFNDFFIKVQYVLLSNKTHVVTYDLGVFKLWSLDDLTSAQRYFEYHSYGVEVHALPNNTVALYRNYPDIIIWDLHEDIILLKGDWSDINCVLNVGSNGLLSGSWSGSIKLWNLDTYECVQNFIGDEVGIMTLNIRNNLLVSSDEADDIRIWNFEGECQRIIETEDVIRKIIFVESKLIYTTGKDIIIWDIYTGHKEATLTGHEFQIMDIQALPNNQIISNSETEFKIWDFYGCIKQWNLECIRSFSVIYDKLLVIEVGELILIE